MSYLYEAIKPTRLYIKQCPCCGLKYFGKSTKEDIRNYPGSGTRWNNHLKKHNTIPEHLWNSDWYDNTSIKKFALRFSKLNMIVESDEWANLKYEDGLEGGWDHVNNSDRTQEYRKEMKNTYSSRSDEEKRAIGRKRANYGSNNGMYGKDRSGDKNPMYGVTLSDETKNKIAESQKGKKASDVTKEKMSAAAQKAWSNSEYKEKMKKIRKQQFTGKPKPVGAAGWYWWNNGYEIMRAKEQPGADWKRGRKINGL